MSDLDLARRAVACPRWRWLDGSQSLWRQRGGVDVLRFRAASGKPYTDLFFLPTAGAWELLGPDLDDPATVGCLLALVREAWSRPFLCALYTLDGHWYVHDMGASFSPHLLALEGIEAPSEAAAMLSALESAP